MGGFFLAYQSWGKPFVCHTSNNNLVISLEINKKKKNVLIEILELPFTPRHIKKQESHPHLGYIHLPLIDFCCCLSPSLSVACYRCTMKDIFEKRNVHECLQCPPH